MTASKLILTVVLCSGMAFGYGLLGCGGDVGYDGYYGDDGCTPDCAGRECGVDGCGGYCGTCDPGENCDSGLCVGCTPDCAGRECGDDGCGGSCPPGCDSGETCEGGQCVEPSPDNEAPNSINDLEITDVTETSVRLEWSATGDDGYEGTASAYDIRYSKSLITDPDWGTYTAAQNPPTPSAPGETDWITITGLSSHTLYDFAIKIGDEKSNWSSISDVVRTWTNSSSLHQVTNNSEAEFCTEWSPDGRWFAYESGDRDIWIIPSGGGSPIEIVSSTASDGEPSWSPDGSKIAFMSNMSGNEDIWVVTIEDGSLQQLTTNPARDNRPSWSPDGSTIAFTSYRGGLGDIWTIPSSGGTAVQITDDPSWGSYYPCWSPDGSKISFIRNEGGGQSEVWTASSTGGTEDKLTSFPVGWCYNPSWSPDGSVIAFDYSYYGGDHNIWIVPAAGGTPTQVTTDETYAMHPSWRPDSERISFRSNRSGEREIWTIEAP